MSTRLSARYFVLADNGDLRRMSQALFEGMLRGLDGHGVPSLAGQTQAAVPAHDYSDLWWNAAEPGWGLNLIQHPSNVLFGVMYTYDDNGRPVWFVLPGGSWTSATVYTGSLYRVTGPAFTTPTFNPALVNVRPVGTATVTFASRESGTFAFSVDGRNVVKPIARQPF